MRLRPLVISGVTAIGAAVVMAPALPATSAEAAPLPTTCFGEPATISAEDQPALEGTEGPDVIVARNVGSISALGGDDLVCFLAGENDATARDEIVIDAGAGDDAVDTSSGVTAIVTSLGEGADRFVGGDSAEEVYPGEGTNVVTTAGGGDVVYSGVPGEENPDLIHLGAGRDLAFVSGLPSGAIVGAAGEDRAELEENAAVGWDVDLGGSVSLGDQTADFTGFEALNIRAARPSPITVTGTTADDDVRVIGRSYGRVLPLDVSLGAGDDHLSIVARPADGSRFRLGAGTDRFDSFGGGSMRRLDGALTEGRVSTESGDWFVTGGDAYAFLGFRDLNLIGSNRPERLQLEASCTIVADGRGGADRIQLGESGGIFDPPATCARSYVARGGAGADVLKGTPRSDVLVGGTGRDVADGRGGGDRCVAEVTRRC